MTIARTRLVDPTVTRWYHCITRCVRRAYLLGEGVSDRKLWIEKRLQELAEIFSIAVGGFSVLDNHLHVLVRLDPDVAARWSDEEVVRRWGRLFAPRDKARQPMAISGDWLAARLKDQDWVDKARTRLQSLSWFMKCLRQDQTGQACRPEERLVVIRPVGESRIDYALSNAGPETLLAEVVRAQRRRHRIKEVFGASKREVGLDH